MNDTPQNIKDLQLKIWLSKSPGERLKQFMEDNTALFHFWNSVQKHKDSQVDKHSEKSTQNRQNK
jgi:hypothetical protein